MKYVPPESGISPIPTKPGTKNASSRAMRMSHAHASERPAPAQTPFTAAITGFSSARMRLTLTWYVARSRSPTLPPSPNSVRSCPAEKPRPAPVMHDGAHVRRSAAAFERLAQPVVHRARERVELVGAVERDRLDRAVPRELDLGHQSASSTNWTVGCGKPRLYASLPVAMNSSLRTAASNASLSANSHSA